MTMARAMHDRDFGFMNYQFDHRAFLQPSAGMSIWGFTGKIRTGALSEQIEHFLPITGQAMRD